MLNFVINQPNTFVATVFQERNNVGNEYFIVFTHEQQQKEYSAEITDTSSFSYRYSLFTVDLPFEHIGDYEYKIYENNTKENLLEVGKMHLTDEPIEPIINNIDISNNIIHGS
jgi:hypothetical protein